MLAGLVAAGRSSRRPGSSALASTRGAILERVRTTLVAAARTLLLWVFRGVGVVRCSGAFGILEVVNVKSSELRLSMKLGLGV